MEGKPVLDIHVTFNRGPSVSLKGENAEVLMIPFDGTVKGEIFNGIVEPCGVDTQILNAVKIRHMSARYMLTGTDCEGKEAHTFYTDSAALAAYLHRNQFVGEGIGEEDGLHIKYYEISHGEE